MQKSASSASALPHPHPFPNPTEIGQRLPIHGEAAFDEDQVAQLLARFGFDLHPGAQRGVAKAAQLQVDGDAGLAAGLVGGAAAQRVGHVQGHAVVEQGQARLAALGRDFVLREQVVAVDLMVVDGADALPQQVRGHAQPGA